MFNSASLLFPLKDRIIFGTYLPLLGPVLEQKDGLEWVKYIPEKAEIYELKFKINNIKKLTELNAKKFLNL